MSAFNSDEEEDKSRNMKDVPVVVDQAFFKFSTGDTYDGTFEAKKKDYVLKMHGPGKYTTADGDVYVGNWHYDNLIDDVTITYQSGSKYEGPIKEWTYSGKGKYTYPDSTVLSCNFHENCPTGDLELKDPNGRVWLAKAAQGFAWFAPTNHYYDMLDKHSDATIRRRKYKNDPTMLNRPLKKKTKHKKTSPKNSPTRKEPSPPRVPTTKKK